MSVFTASSSLEAHLARIYLQSQGIEAYVSDDLQGGLGELPALGIARVWVDDAQAERAQQLLNQWQA